jgi:hypothetical protein
MAFTIEVLGDTAPECDEGLLIVYSSVYMGDDTVKTAKLVLRNDDGPASGCGADPFTLSPVEPAAWDGGTPDAPLPTTAIDAKTGEVPPTVALDAAADGPLPAVRDSGAGGVGSEDAPGPARIRNSGCSCAFEIARGEGWLCFLAALAVLVMLRRARRRSAG